ncbi:hypothetical protein [Micromonospora psammae]|uniref:hypothetical protein n=1 Tax=Micromonospora sp. CPCC 205556 TaxID=3122398 RepID=UPI002FF37D8C
MRWRLALLGLVTAVVGVAGIGVGLAGLWAGRLEMGGLVALGGLALLLVAGLARDMRRSAGRSGRRSHPDASVGWYSPAPAADAGADRGCGVPEPGPSDFGRSGGGSGFWGGSDGGSGSHSGSDSGGSSWGGGSDGGGGSY